MLSETIRTRKAIRKRGPDRIKRCRRTREQIAADRLEALLVKCENLSSGPVTPSDITDEPFIEQPASSSAAPSHSTSMSETAEESSSGSSSDNGTQCITQSKAQHCTRRHTALYQGCCLYCLRYDTLGNTQTLRPTD